PADGGHLSQCHAVGRAVHDLPLRFRARQPELDVGTVQIRACHAGLPSLASHLARRGRQHQFRRHLHDLGHPVSNVPDAGERVAGRLRRRRSGGALPDRRTARLSISPIAPPRFRMSIDAGTIHRAKTFSLGHVPAWLWLGIGVYALAVINGRALLNDSDTCWQIAVGQWILDHNALPRVDFYSFTKAGEPWVSSSWLSQVVLATSFNLAGWTGPIVLTAACIAMTFAMLTWILGQRLPAPFAIVVALVALLVPVQHLLARPHVLVMPVMLAWAYGLLSASERGRAPSFWLLPLIALWANLHGGFVFGLVLAGGF